MHLVGAMLQHTPYLDRFCGADEELKAIVAAAVLAESGGRFDARGDFDPVDGHPHSVGPFQMHDQGEGQGMSVAEREDPERCYPHMVPLFRRWRDYWRAQGFGGEELAARACLYTERPADYTNPLGAAARRYRESWSTITGGATGPGGGDSGASVPGEAWRDRLLAAARTLVGTPYALPPRPGTLDCSLFVLRAHELAGAPLPAELRTAEQIRLACDLVTSSDEGWDDARVQVGDLLFFERTGGETPGERAGHIGFALLGQRMLDANDGRGSVGVTDISTAYWQERLFEVRRAPRRSAPDEGGRPSVEEQLAAERAWGAAIQRDVIQRSRLELEAALAGGVDVPRIQRVIEWLRRHEPEETTTVRAREGPSPPGPRSRKKGSPARPPRRRGGERR